MHENQPVVRGAKIDPGKPEFLEQLRLIVGHENGRRFDQPDQRIATLRASEVESDAFLFLRISSQQWFKSGYGENGGRRRVTPAPNFTSRSRAESNSADRSTPRRDLFR